MESPAVALFVPGPDLVVVCPHCSAVARIITLETVDPAGAISWTDGCQEIPGVPAQPNVTRCPACRKLFWATQAQQIGWYAPGIELPPEQESWHTAPTLQRLDAEGYLEALDSGMAQNSEQELELRVYAWWRGNDRFRHLDTPGRYVTDERLVKNMERMIELCANGDHEILLFRAEAYRELGRFEEATEALYGLCSDYALARERLAALIQEKSRDLAVLFS